MSTIVVGRRCRLARSQNGNPSNPLLDQSLDSFLARCPYYRKLRGCPAADESLQQLINCRRQRRCSWPGQNIQPRFFRAIRLNGFI